MIHLDVLLAAARRILRNHQDAEDIVQETYLRAWKYFNTFKPGSNCRAWLFRIMFNAINAMRGKQARMPLTPLEDIERMDNQKGNVITFDPLRNIEGGEVLRAMSLLSEEYRTTLWLVVVEEFSYRETAVVLDVPIGTVMSRLHRARKELRKLLATEKACSAAGGC
ncbi:MAG: sigma-70 family RNA polymerase sigma factor [Blastocatellia bacterium]|nr:sigma-70 family RNA polymerase sigma factor [Blastocatellia bacterium]